MFDHVWCHSKTLALKLHSFSVFVWYFVPLDYTWKLRSSNIYSVLITLQHGTNPNSSEGVQLSIRFHPDPLISLSQKIDGHWGNEVISRDVQFGEGDTFRIKISASCGQFVAHVNDTRLAMDFPGDVQSLTHVILDGEADFSVLDFPTYLVRTPRSMLYMHKKHVIAKNDTNF